MVTPITWPAPFTSGPPESPARTLAATSIKPVSSSELPVSASLASIVRSRRVMVPGFARRRAARVRVADRHRRFADDDRCRVAQRRDRQAAGPAQLQQCDVVYAVVADQVDPERLAGADVVGGDDVGALHHVEVGQDLAAGVEQEAGARTDRVLVVDRGVDLDDGRFYGRDRGVQRRRSSDRRADRRHQRHHGGKRDQQAIQVQAGHMETFGWERILITSWQ